MFRLDGQRSSAQTWLWSAQTVDEECLALPNPHSCQLKHNRASTQSPEHRDSQHTQSSESHPLVPLISAHGQNRWLATNILLNVLIHGPPVIKTIFAPGQGAMR